MISGEREARLAFSSVQHAFDLSGRNVVVADIGGGSTEIVFATGNLIESIFSTPLGRGAAHRAVRRSARSAERVRPTSSGSRRRSPRCLKKRTTRPLFAPHFLVGCGGTFTTLAELVMAAKKQVDVPVAGYKVSQAEVRHLLDRLRKMPLRARRGMAGMTPDRADIIIAGLTIIDALMKRFRVNTLVIHTRGVRDGLRPRDDRRDIGSPAPRPTTTRTATRRSSGWRPPAPASSSTAGRSPRSPGGSSSSSPSRSSSCPATGRCSNAPRGSRTWAT